VEVSESLRQYLRRIFHLSDQDATETFDYLVHHHFRPPSAKSWRAYVRLVSHWTPEGKYRRRHSSTFVVGDEDLPIRGHSHPQSSDDPRFTVESAARAMAVPPSTLYEWIRKGRVVVERNESSGRGRMRISRTEVERLEALRRPKQKPLIDRCMAVRGGNRDAARKWAWRQQAHGHSVEEIAGRLRDDHARQDRLETLPLNQRRNIRKKCSSPRALRPSTPGKMLPHPKGGRKTSLTASGLEIPGGWGPPAYAAPSASPSAGPASAPQREVSQPLTPELIAEQLAKARENERTLAPLKFATKTLDRSERR
jgi:excisionase family DNA binding protein